MGTRTVAKNITQRSEFEHNKKCEPLLWLVDAQRVSVMETNSCNHD